MLTLDRIRTKQTSLRRSVALAAAAVLSLAATQLAALSWIVPGVANTPGLNGVTFFSDLTAVNPSGADLRVTFSLIPGQSTQDQPPKSYTIAGGAAMKFDNVLATVWATSGTGALRVTADGAVRLFGRTYAFTPTVMISGAPLPTFGAALPVVEEGSLLQAGDTGHSPWATQSSDITQGDRTNVAVAFPDEGGGAATLTLFDDLGTPLGSLFFDSPRAAFLQRSLAALTSAEVVGGRIAVNVLRGRACGYTATADSGTGDLTVIPTERLPTRPHASVSSGVAQLPGANGAFWQTEARVANVGTQPVSVTAFLLGVPGQTLPTYFTVPAGRTQVTRSLVTSMFQFSGAAAGEVLWTSDGPLVIATRTSSAVTLPFAAGSAGDGRAAVPVAAFLSAADGTADLGDLRSGAFSRSNLLVAAGPEGAAYTLEARDETGRPVGSYSGTLAVLGWAEFSVAGLFPASGDRSQLRVTVESGSANVQAGVVDGLTNDLVLYEASPRAAVSPSPPLPAGVWGSPDGFEGLRTDATTILVEKFCRNGSFDQPAHLDAAGRFAVFGRFVENAPAPFSFAAILTGQTDGQTATISVSDIFGFNWERPATYTLGKSYKVPSPGSCPVEY